MNTLKGYITIYYRLIFRNSYTCLSENGKYLANIIEDFVIMSDEVIEDTRTVTTDEKK